MQSAVTIERQLPANMTAAATYTNAHGVHLFRSNGINAPLAGTGVAPIAGRGPMFLMQSDGIYNQNQFIANVNARVNPSVSMFGFYVLNHAAGNNAMLGVLLVLNHPFSTEARLERAAHAALLKSSWPARHSGCMPSS